LREILPRVEIAAPHDNHEATIMCAHTQRERERERERERDLSDLPPP